MKVALISVFPDMSSYGLRSISACLKRAGHTVDMFLIPRPLYGACKAGYASKGPASVELSEKATEAALADLVRMTDRADLIGISVMSNFMDEVVQITRRLKKEGRGPIIWGGIHPTVDPEKSLEYADMVCVGEGEEAMLDLVGRIEKGAPIDRVPNIWLKCNGVVVKNAVRPLIQDLNRLPFQDFDYESHHVVSDDGFVKMTSDILQSYMISPTFGKETYVALPSRGCCFSCTYCCNNHLNNLYKGQKIVRKRTIEHIMEELRQAKQKMPFLKRIEFEDDAFSYAFTLEEVRRFSEEYKRDIGLDLFVTGIAPATIDEDKFGCLIDAGMVSTRLGIQTGSETTLKLYNRKQTNQQVKAAAAIVNKYKDKLEFVQYDLILDNPWETERDLMDSLILLNELPAPYLVCLQSLTFFPGTDLYRRAVSEGKVQDAFEDIYRKHFSRPQDTYFSKLFYRVRASKARGPMARFVGNREYPEVATWKLKLLRNDLVRWAHKHWSAKLDPKIHRLKTTLRMMLGKPTSSAVD